MGPLYENKSIIGLVIRNFGIPLAVAGLSPGDEQVAKSRRLWPNYVPRIPAYTGHVTKVMCNSIYIHRICSQQAFFSNYHLHIMSPPPRRPTRTQSRRMLSSLSIVFFALLALLALCPAPAKAEETNPEYGIVIGIGMCFTWVSLCSKWLNCCITQIWEQRALRMAIFWTILQTDVSLFCALAIHVLGKPPLSMLTELHLKLSLL